MKNIFIALHALSIVGLITLFVLFSSQNNAESSSSKPLEKEKKEVKSEKDKPQEKAQKTKKEGPKLETDGNYAFVNFDTLLLNYAYYKKIEKQLRDKRNYIQSDLQKRQASFENEAITFQQSIAQGTITEEMAMAKQQELGQKQQELIQYGQTTEAQYLKEEQDMNKKVNSRIREQIKAYAEESGFDFIFSYSINSISIGMMYGDAGYDVTSEVLERLNETYKEEGK